MHARDGFSLVELMIVVVASTVVMAGFLGMYGAGVQLERRAEQDLESRYLAVFSQDRVMVKVRASSALVRVTNTVFGAVLVYERVPLVIVSGSNQYVEDLTAEDSFSGVIYRSGENLFLRERRPIGTAANRLIASIDLISEAAANQGSGSQAAVAAFLTGDAAALANTREELTSTDLSTLDLGDTTIRIIANPDVGTSRFNAVFNLSHLRPPVTI